MKVGRLVLTNWRPRGENFDILEAATVGLCSFVLQTNISDMVSDVDQPFEDEGCLRQSR